MWAFGYDGQTRSLTESITAGTQFNVFFWWFSATSDNRLTTQSGSNVGSDNLRYRQKEVMKLQETFVRQMSPLL